MNDEHSKAIRKVSKDAVAMIEDIFMSYNDDYIKGMRKASGAAAAVLEYIQPYVVKGVTSAELDTRIYNFIVNKLKAVPGTVGFMGYKHTSCISVNPVICHGVPNDRTLKDGDLLNIDVVVQLDGYYGDTSRMYKVGNVTKEAEQLCYHTQQSLYNAIKLVRPGLNTDQIGKCIEDYINSKGYYVVPTLCGHGIGKSLHEKPTIIHTRDHMAKDVVLKEGMTFTIEPLVSVGSINTKLCQDGWSLMTDDESLCAQYEHTILVTKTGCEVLTLRVDDKIPGYIGE